MDWNEVFSGHIADVGMSGALCALFIWGQYKGKIRWGSDYDKLLEANKKLQEIIDTINNRTALKLEELEKRFRGED
jgi:hypothetical protein